MAPFTPLPVHSLWSKLGTFPEDLPHFIREPWKHISGFSWRFLFSNTVCNFSQVVNSFFFLFLGGEFFSLDFHLMLSSSVLYYLGYFEEHPLMFFFSSKKKSMFALSLIPVCPLTNPTSKTSFSKAVANEIYYWAILSKTQSTQVIIVHKESAKVKTFITPSFGCASRYLKIKKNSQWRNLGHSCKVKIRE